MELIHPAIEQCFYHTPNATPFSFSSSGQACTQGALQCFALQSWQELLPLLLLTGVEPATHNPSEWGHSVSIPKSRAMHAALAHKGIKAGNEEVIQHPLTAW